MLTCLQILAIKLSFLSRKDMNGYNQRSIIGERHNDRVSLSFFGPNDPKVYFTFYEKDGKGEWNLGKHRHWLELTGN